MTYPTGDTLNGVLTLRIGVTLGVRRIAAENDHELPGQSEPSARLSGGCGEIDYWWPYKVQNMIVIGDREGEKIPDARRERGVPSWMMESPLLRECC
jgi:hypothetical protein